MENLKEIGNFYRKIAKNDAEKAKKYPFFRYYKGCKS